MAPNDDIDEKLQKRLDEIAQAKPPPYKKISRKPTSFIASIFVTSYIGSAGTVDDKRHISDNTVDDKTYISNKAVDDKTYISNKAVTAFVIIVAVIGVFFCGWLIYCWFNNGCH